MNHFNIQKLSDLPNIDELGSAGLIDTSTIDKSIFGTGKFFKEQSISEKQNIYEDIDEAIKKLQKKKNKYIFKSFYCIYFNLWELVLANSYCSCPCSFTFWKG